MPCSYLDHLALGAQARQGKGWICACGDDQVHLGRLAIQQAADGLVDRDFSNCVVIVQDKHERSGRNRYVVDQGSDECLRGRRVRRAEKALEGLADRRFDLLEGCNQIREKSGEIIVALVKGKPGDRFIQRQHPFSGQAGLAKPCGGRDQGELFGYARIQVFDQAWTWRHSSPRHRHV